uniref:Uncharacterized protein n=1 Tax=Ananas comosus var. bracteatus TaxID=296719 RepID=A0A6V7QMA0_ANACO|nr:unnamed protein product [Ananas comosus var. bracteatus]
MGSGKLSLIRAQGKKQILKPRAKVSPPFFRKKPFVDQLHALGLRGRLLRPRLLQPPSKPSSPTASTLSSPPPPPLIPERSSASSLIPGRSRRRCRLHPVATVCRRLGPLGRAAVQRLRRARDPSSFDAVQAPATPPPRRTASSSPTSPTSPPLRRPGLVIDYGTYKISSRTFYNWSFKCNKHLSSDDDQPEENMDSSKKSRNGRGPTRMHKIWARRDGEQLALTFNEFDQPIGDDAAKFTNFLGTIARSGNDAPLTYRDWRHMPLDNKKIMWNTVKLKYNLGCKVPNF